MSYIGLALNEKIETRRPTKDLIWCLKILIWVSVVWEARWLVMEKQRNGFGQRKFVFICAVDVCVKCLCLLCSTSVYLVSPVCEIGNGKPSFPKIAKQLSETFLLPTYADSQHVVSYRHLSQMHTKADTSSYICIQSLATFHLPFMRLQ